MLVRFTNWFIIFFQHSFFFSIRVSSLFKQRFVRWWHLVVLSLCLQYWRLSQDFYPTICYLNGGIKNNSNRPINNCSQLTLRSIEHIGQDFFPPQSILIVWIIFFFWNQNPFGRFIWKKNLFVNQLFEDISLESWNAIYWIQSFFCHVSCWKAWRIFVVEKTILQWYADFNIGASVGDKKTLDITYSQIQQIPIDIRIQVEDGFFSSPTIPSLNRICIVSNLFSKFVVFVLVEHTNGLL